VMDVCRTKAPPLEPVINEPNHLQACHLDEETKDREAARLLQTLASGAA